jgi:hypothetical protein
VIVVGMILEGSKRKLESIRVHKVGKVHSFEITNRLASLLDGKTSTQGCIAAQGPAHNFWKLEGRYGPLFCCV